MKNLEVGMLVNVVSLPSYISYNEPCAEGEVPLLGAWVTIDKIDKSTKFVRIVSNTGKTYWLSESKVGVALSKYAEIGSVYASASSLRDGHTLSIIEGLNKQAVIIDDFDRKIISVQKFRKLITETSDMVMIP